MLIEAVIRCTVQVKNLRLVLVMLRNAASDTFQLGMGDAGGPEPPSADGTNLAIACSRAVIRVERSIEPIGGVAQRTKPMFIQVYCTSALSGSLKP
ncbi:MAG: hypothetical protein AAFV54_06435 [Pseudomonadota bacterium]